MKVKYSGAADPLRKEQKGVTYFRPSSLKYAARGQANDRNRNRRQINRKANLMAAVRHWRNLPEIEKTAWNTFAADFPQPCKFSGSGFLTGYQIFVKRQQYCFLNYGLSNEFLAAPMQRELLPVNVNFAISGVHQVIDVTELYVANFGILPTAGQKLLFKCLPMAIDSGQFFPIVVKVLTVEQVFIDGLFVSLEIAPHSVPIVWSVYLSKPISNGRKYTGTKCRYMGCFTSKTFLQLLDTPSNYAGQAGKIVKVKADESGLEFGDGGGGGLTCETLPACPTIISIQDAIDILNEIVNPTPASVWLFVEGNAVRRSLDGLTWGIYTPGMTFQTESSMLYIRDWRIWIGSTSRPVWADELGLSFYLSASNPFSSAKKVSYDGKGLAVMVGSGTVNSMAYSGNGKIWSGLGIAALGKYAISILYAANIWVAGSYNDGQANTMAYSLDGITWVGLGKTIFTVECCDIAYGNGRFVAVGRGTKSAAYSLDGVTWVATSNVFSTKGWRVIFFKGYFVCGATNGLWKSADGITWELVHPDAATWGTPTNWALATDGNLIVSKATLSKYSYDLITWFDSTLTSGKEAGGCTLNPYLTQ